MSSNETPPRLPEEEASTFLRNTAIAGTVIAPAAMLLPPRKIDIRFFVLAGAFSLSTNYLAHSYTGESLYSRFQRRMVGMLPGTGLPPEAERTQRLLREHRQREAAMRQQQRQAEAVEVEAAATGGLAKKVEDVWMGGEGQDWQKKRAEEHQKQFDEGKGMGSIIMDQISDVWSGNWRAGSKKEGDGSSEDAAKGEKR